MDPRCLHRRHRRRILPEGAAMNAFLLFLIVIGVGAYLLVAMLRPDKF